MTPLAYVTGTCLCLLLLHLGALSTAITYDPHHHPYEPLHHHHHHHTTQHNLHPSYSRTYRYPDLARYHNPLHRHHHSMDFLDVHRPYLPAGYEYWRSSHPLDLTFHSRFKANHPNHPVPRHLHTFHRRSSLTTRNPHFSSHISDRNRAMNFLHFLTRSITNGDPPQLSYQDRSRYIDSLFEPLTRRGEATFISYLDSAPSPSASSLSSETIEPEYRQSVDFDLGPQGLSRADDLVDPLATSGSEDDYEVFEGLPVTSDELHEALHPHLSPSHHHHHQQHDRISIPPPPERHANEPTHYDLHYH